MSRDAVAEHAQSFQRKLTELAAAEAGGQHGVEVRLTADEVERRDEPGERRSSVGDGAGSGGTPKADPYQITFKNDVVRGRFTTALKGKQLYVTLGGHVGVSDGYVTFTPTESESGPLDSGWRW